MAPVLLDPQFVVEVLQGEFPRVARPTPPPPELDDVFVIVVAIGVVGSITIFVLVQAVYAVKSMLDTSSGSPLCALPSFRKKPLLPDGRTSPFLGPHRCEFTLSPERYDTDSDSSSTLTRSSSSDSTVVGGRICVVYDDTDEIEGMMRVRADAEDEAEEQGCALSFAAEPRPRPRRERHWLP